MGNVLNLWAILALPLFITLETALLAQTEHSEKHWKHLFALAVPRWVYYAAKWLTGRCWFSWSAGRVRRCDAGGSALVRYALPASPVVRIVDVDTSSECAPDAVGEIWVCGDNVAAGYWSRTAEEQQCFGATITDPSPGTPAGRWLRTGDLGFVHDGALFIVGRIKDLLIIRGRNHYPEDIEATVQEITRGRVAAIAVPVNSTEKLVTVIELKKRTDIGADPMGWLHEVEERRHLGDLHGARAQRRRPRAGDARVDPDDDQRQGATRRLRRALPDRPVRAIGCLSAHSGRLLASVTALMTLGVAGGFGPGVATADEPPPVPPPNPVGRTAAAGHAGPGLRAGRRARAGHSVRRIHHAHRRGLVPRPGAADRRLPRRTGAGSHAASG